MADSTGSAASVPGTTLVRSSVISWSSAPCTRSSVTRISTPAGDICAAAAKGATGAGAGRSPRRHTKKASRPRFRAVKHQNRPAVPNLSITCEIASGLRAEPRELISSRPWIMRTSASAGARSAAWLTATG